MLTSSLDGEKNLKPKLALKSLQDNLSSILAQKNSKLEITIQHPDHNLYKFNGLLKIEDKIMDIELK